MKVVGKPFHLATRYLSQWCHRAEYLLKAGLQYRLWTVITSTLIYTAAAGLNFYLECICILIHSGGCDAFLVLGFSLAWFQLNPLSLYILSISVLHFLLGLPFFVFSPPNAKITPTISSLQINYISYI